MATVFDNAVEFVLKHEGGYVDNSKDPGGATKYGISLRFLKHWDGSLFYDYDHDNEITKKDIQALTVEQAKEIYKTAWWEYYQYDKLKDPKLATKVFDISVNIGPKRANKFLQQSCNYLITEDDNKLSEDGIMGPRTIEVANNLTSMQSSIALCYFIRKTAEFYQNLAKMDHDYVQFLKGWLKRVHDDKY